jgi:hypothetical protein
MLFIGDIPIRYNRYNNLLFIDMQWDARVSVGSFIIAEVYLVFDWNNSQTFWGDSMLKQLTTALIKRQFGENLKKFAGVQLPNGMIANGQQIYDEAVTEIERLKVYIRDTYEPPVEFLTG